MTSFAMSSKKVKAIGCIDFVLTIATMVLITCQIIVPLSPYYGVGSEGPRSPARFRIGEWNEREGRREPMKPFEFCFFVGLFGTIGVMGISWSLVLVKVAVFPDIRSQVRVQLLGYWLLCNGIIGALMLYLGIWLFSSGPKETDNDTELYSTQIPYVVCYLIRLVLVYLIWRERIRMLTERRLSNEEVEKWLKYLAGYNKKPKQGHAV